MNSSLESGPSSNNRPLSRFRRRSFKFYCLIGSGLALIPILGMIIAIPAISKQAKKAEPPDPESPLPPSLSILRKFNNAAVCADASVCSEIGRDILQKNGSAVDAAIASLFCNGIINSQSMGIGGGFLMTIYERKTKTSYVLNAREVAPESTNEELYRENPKFSEVGALSAGVPGELAGYWAAHQRFGRLPWRELIKPSLKICREGYMMTLHQYDSLNFRPENIYNDEIFRELFVNASTGKFHPPGTKIIRNQFCKTLEIIAEHGAEVLYNGSLANLFVSDVQKMGGIITLKDMQNYRVRWDNPVVMDLQDGIRLHSVPLPGNGAILSLILNILRGYNFSKKSISNLQETILTYHRIIEAFKFAFATRTQLGDPRFVNVDEIIRNSTNHATGDSLRAQINDSTTFNDPEHYGGVFSNREDHGTAHISVVSPEGDAVSVTSTINFYFGAGVTSKSTGIVLNNVINDFSSQFFESYFRLPVSPANKLEPGKQPLSSMCPSVLVDSNGDVRLVVGAAGGTKIITAVAYVIIRHLLLQDDIKAAVDASRIHHQLIPKSLSYEYGIPQPIVMGLQKLGHETNRFRKRSSVVCGIAKINGTIFANADYRKGGDAYGF